METKNIRKRKRIFKLLGIDESYLDSLKFVANSKDFNFDEEFDDKFTTLHDLDNLIEEKYYWTYIYDVPFQMVYPFLSQFEFLNRADFIECVIKLKKHVRECDVEELEKDILTIKRTHSSIAKKFNKDKQLAAELKELEKCYKNKKVVDYLKQTFNDEKFKYEFQNPSVYIGQEKIGQIFMLWLFLREEFRKLNIVEILKNENVESFIIEKIKERLKITGSGQKAKQKFFKEIIDTHITNGFLFHGTNESYIKNIKKFGLTGCNLKFNSKELLEIDEIMKSHNIEMTFEGKTNEITHIKYYATLNVHSAIYYATQSPEFLSRFCGNGYTLKGLDFDCNAFWRRDFKSCLKNVETICDKNFILGKEKQNVIKGFKSIWTSNVKKNHVTPIIVLIPKKVVGLDKINLDELKNVNISKMSYSEIFSYVLNMRGNFVRRFSNIPRNSFQYMKLPCTPKLIKTKTNVPKEKYVTVDGEKIKIDGIIKIKDEFRGGKIVFVKMSGNELLSIYDKQKRRVSFEDLNKVFYMDKSLELLLAERGFALSDKCSDMLKQLRKKISIKDMQKVNKELAKTKIEEGLKHINDDYHYSLKCYAQAVFCISNNIAMQRTGKCIADINEGYLFKIENCEVDDGYWGIDSTRNNQIDKVKLKENLERINKML